MPPSWPAQVRPRFETVEVSAARRRGEDALGNRQQQTGLEAAVGRVAGDDARTMSDGNGFDDGQAETGPGPGAGFWGAAEALEDAVTEVGRRAGALVVNGELDAFGGRGCAKGDVAAAVRERVVDQIDHDLLEPEVVAVDDNLRRSVDPNAAPALLGEHLDATRRRLEDVDEPDRASLDLEALLVAPGDGQQVLGQATEALGVAARGLQRSLEFAGRSLAHECELDL